MEEKFKIESGVPMPDKNHRSAIYPFAQMKVGDSFLYSDVYSQRLQMRAYSAARNWKSHSNIEGVKDWVFTTRKVDNTIRIWRIK